MPALIDDVVLTCPYCGSAVEIDVDCTAGSQVYFEDCQTCCAGMEIHTHVDEKGNLVMAEARREDG
jgi:hypothetical protein